MPDRGLWEGLIEEDCGPGATVDVFGVLWNPGEAGDSTWELFVVKCFLYVLHRNIVLLGYVIWGLCKLM